MNLVMLKWTLTAMLVVWAIYLLFWPTVAWVLTRRPIFEALKRRAMTTPYWHLTGYMDRWWLFNPFEKKIGFDGVTTKATKYPWCPVSVRLHHILRADHARDPHGHPGSFRTLIGPDGWYIELRDGKTYLRRHGDTATLLADEFHHVSEVSPGGVWTIFIMWDWRGTWGFRLDDGTVVPHDDYRNNGHP